MSKIKFPKELREKWLKALRSGKYKQTDGSLEDGGAYCCLGVCARKLNIPINNLSRIGDLRGINKKFIKLIPKALVKGTKNTKFCNTLIDMNDEQEKSFKEIANYIEEKTVGV